MTPDPSWPPHIAYFAEQTATAVDLARLGIVGFAVFGGLVLALLAAHLVVGAYRT